MNGVGLVQLKVRNSFGSPPSTSHFATRPIGKIFFWYFFELLMFSLPFFPIFPPPPPTFIQAHLTAFHFSNTSCLEKTNVSFNKIVLFLIVLSPLEEEALIFAESKMIDEGGRLEFLPLEPAPPPYAVNPSYHQTPSAPGQQSLQQTTTFQPDIARMPSTSMPLPYQQPTQGQSINQPMSTVDQRLGTAKVIYQPVRTIFLSFTGLNKIYQTIFHYSNNLQFTRIRLWWLRRPRAGQW